MKISFFQYFFICDNIANLFNCSIKNHFHYNCLCFLGYHYTFFNSSIFLIACVAGISDNSAAFYSLLSASNSSSSSSSSNNSSPTVGGNGSISVTYVGPYKIDISWTTATDDVSASSKLRYGVYYSTSDNISTLADAKSNGTLASSYSENISSLSVSGLIASTTYYINIIVQDEAGNESAYTATSRATVTNDIVRIFSSDATNNGNLGGRTGIDAACYSKYVSTYSSSLTCKYVKGFISIDANDEIRDIPGNYFVPTDLYVYGIRYTTGVQHTLITSNYWAGLLATNVSSLSSSMQSALGLNPTDYYWTGSLFDGSLSSSNCNTFTDSSNSYPGETGTPTSLISPWLTNGPSSCDISRYFLCVCY